MKIVDRAKLPHVTPKESYSLHLCHENVVGTVAVLVAECKHFDAMVIEHPGNSGDMQRLVDRTERPAPPRVLLGFAADVANGLQYCHRCGVLHLDLKPTNILVWAAGACKICDFGNCFGVGSGDDDGGRLGLPGKNLIRAPDVKVSCFQGTVAYTTPEILLRRTSTKVTDLYSFGIVLWQMAHGEVPYEDIDHNDVLIYRIRLSVQSHPSTQPNLFLCEGDILLDTIVINVMYNLY